MGVKDLWQILEPTREAKIPLTEFRGKTVAVDLGFWVCQLQTAVPNPTVLRPYLRNLFFRIVGLLQRDIRLVFVTEGKAPELKNATIRERQRIRGEISESISQSSRPIKRPRFQAALNECCELIRLLGLTVIESDGEAEAFCSALNMLGIVDGVVSDDSDCFLYGAQCVLRGFGLEGKEPTVDVYRMRTIENKLGLDREKLVCSALLLGCDYCPKGVPGVGKESVFKFLQTVSSGTELLQKLRNTTAGSNESVMKKAAKVDGFPDERVLDEFLRTRTLPTNMQKHWKIPNLIRIQEFMMKKLEWVEEYTVAKIVPLISLWDLRRVADGAQPVLTPTMIVKSRVKNGLPFLEVQWIKLDCDQTTLEDFYVTLEQTDLFTSAYPRFVEDFESAKKSKKKRTTKAKKDDSKQQQYLAVHRIPSEDIAEILERSLILIEDEAEEKAELEQSFRDFDFEIDFTTDSQSPKPEYHFESRSRAEKENQPITERPPKIFSKTTAAAVPKDAVDELSISLLGLDVEEKGSDNSNSKSAAKPNTFETPPSYAELPLIERLKLRGLDVSAFKTS